MAIRYVVEPVKIPDFSPVYQEVERALREEGQDTARMYDRAFQTWSERPSAAYRVTMDRARGMGWVDNYPSGDEGLIQVVEWVWFGTKPHDIFPLGDYPLRFPGTFTPKTQPGVIDSGAGGKSGRTVETYYVEHPGVTARYTHLQIDQERRLRVILRLQAATRRGVEIANRRVAK